MPAAADRALPRPAAARARRPGRDPERGVDAAGRGAGDLGAGRRAGAAQARGREPDRHRFKDRGMTVAVSRAKGAGAEAVICASTGNTAASAAAYAARAGMRGAVIVPEGKIAIGKLAQALMHGARVIALRGNFDDALRDRPRARPAPPDRARQLGQPVPDRGPEDGRLRGLRGARRARPTRSRSRSATPATSPPGGAGFREYERRRRSSTASRPRARRRSSAASRSPSPRRSPRRSGSATRRAGRRRWTAVTASRGRIAAVSDEQILDAYRLLASGEGVFCEPASAASVAGLLAHGLPVADGGRAARARSSACSPATASRTPTRRSARRRR